MTKRIAILMTCHNRMADTRACLRSLTGDWPVFLVDDGSSDGTSEMVRRERPDATVINGTGDLFWAKGMALAWRTAVGTGMDWDGFLWLNDDTVLRPDALEKMCAADDGESIVVGELVDETGRVVYGRREGGLFTGNCVLVPRSVFRRLGMICGDYAHAWADSDYAMRAKRRRVRVVSAGVVGQTSWHPNRPSLKGLPFRARVAALSDPKGWCVRDLWLYRRRNWGVFAAVFSCAHLIAHVLIGER